MSESINYQLAYNSQISIMASKELKIKKLQQENTNLKQALNKIKEYVTSYECISIIQGLDNIEENKSLDEKTITEMTNRYLKVHDNILQIINEALGDDDSENNDNSFNK